MIKKILKPCIYILIFSTFLFYWAETLLYNTPNNFIRIEFIDNLTTFQNFFGQKWQFFAPPPDYNNRIYFLYYDKNKKLKWQKEVLEKLLQEKKRKAPFNPYEETHDYILSGCILQINDYLHTQLSYSKLAFPDSSESYHYTRASLALDNETKSLPSLRTLVNFAKVSKHDLPKEDCVFLKIVVTKKDIPKFKDRFTKVKEKETSLVSTSLIEI